MKWEPASFEPTARVIKSEAAKCGVAMRILTDEKGRIACQMPQCDPGTVQTIAERALRIIRNGDVVSAA